MPLDGDENSKNKGVSSFMIEALYCAFLPEFVRENHIFMHYNATGYTAYIVRALLRDLGIKVMDWPPYSPNVNPIENLRTLMKVKIYELHPKLERAHDTEETLDRLVAAEIEA